MYLLVLMASWATHLVEHTIDTGSALPIASRPYRPTMHNRKIIDEEIGKMLKADLIEPSESPWASPVILVTKSDGSPRFVVDYRKLNQCTVKDSWPLPNISDCLNSFWCEVVFNHRLSLGLLAV